MAYTFTRSMNRFIFQCMILLYITPRIITILHGVHSFKHIAWNYQSNMGSNYVIRLTDWRVWMLEKLTPLLLLIVCFQKKSSKRSFFFFVCAYRLTMQTLNIDKLSWNMETYKQLLMVIYINILHVVINLSCKNRTVISILGRIVSPWFV
jgi:hypothetical protein